MNNSKLHPYIKFSWNDSMKENLKVMINSVKKNALTIVVNSKNTWAKNITVDELGKMWAPQGQGKITKRTEY